MYGGGYEPHKPNRRFLKFMSRFAAVLVAGMWLIRRKFGIDSSSMCILTGIALFNLVMQSIDSKAVEQNYLNAKAIRENRETIDKGDIGTDDIDI